MIESVESRYGQVSFTYRGAIVHGTVIKSASWVAVGQ